MTRQERIKEKLTVAFQPTFLKVIDESTAHFGHAGYAAEGSHFAIEISADIFKDKKPIESHRLIYAALGDMLPIEIHALRIKIIAEG